VRSHMTISCCTEQQPLKEHKSLLCIPVYAILLCFLINCEVHVRGFNLEYIKLKFVGPCIIVITEE